jgi:hypothetical protein
LADKKNSTNEEHPVFIQPSTKSAGGSNPADGCFGHTHGVKVPPPAPTPSAHPRRRREEREIVTTDMLDVLL